MGRDNAQFLSYLSHSFHWLCELSFAMCTNANEHATNTGSNHVVGPSNVCNNGSTAQSPTHSTACALYYRNFLKIPGSSQTWLFQTWLFAIFTRKWRKPLFCALLQTCVCAHLRLFAWFCVRPRLERLRLGTAEIPEGNLFPVTALC